MRETEREITVLDVRVRKFTLRPCRRFFRQLQSIPPRIADDMSVEEKVLSSSLFSLQYLQQDFPEELPHWNLCEDVLEGLDQFLESSSEILLNARDAAGADPEHAASDPSSESQGRAQEPVIRAWT